MKKISVIILILLAAIQGISAQSATKSDADKAYQESQYAEAAKIYETLLDEHGESVEIYYNLGNCYYKQKNVAKAVLCYERALLLDPGNADIRFNLDMAKSKAVDKITPVSEVFILTWVKSLINLRSESQWSSIAISAFILLLIGGGLYIFGNKLILKKIGFIGALIFLLVTVFANWFAHEQKNKLVNRNGAIIMSPTITVRSTPNESGTSLFVLHEGTKVYIDDDSMKGWKEIRLEDGKKGWLPTNSIERI